MCCHRKLFCFIAVHPHWMPCSSVSVAQPPAAWESWNAPAGHAWSNAKLSWVRVYSEVDVHCCFMLFIWLSGFWMTSEPLRVLYLCVYIDVVRRNLTVSRPPVKRRTQWNRRLLLTKRASPASSLWTHEHKSCSFWWFFESFLTGREIIAQQIWLCQAKLVF